jgi:hypothetical protein
MRLVVVRADAALLDGRRIAANEHLGVDAGEDRVGSGADDH